MVAINANQTEAYQTAFATDPESSFGGIIAFNRPLEVATAKAIVDNQFAEVIIAPSIDNGVLDVTAKRNASADLRWVTKSEWACTRFRLQTSDRGLLVQTADMGLITEDDLKIVTKVANFCSN